VAVVRVVSVRKMNLALGSPLASRVMVAAEKVNLPIHNVYLCIYKHIFTYIHIYIYIFIYICKQMYVHIHI
jgi:hypothetical protein